MTAGLQGHMNAVAFEPSNHAAQTIRSITRNICDVEKEDDPLMQIDSRANP